MKTVSSKSVVITEAAIRAADQLKIPAAAFAAIIGLDEATAASIRRGGLRLEPGTKPFELAVLFVRLFCSLDAIVGGDDEVAASWLASPNTFLDARPIEKLQTVTGLVDVIAHLDARRALV
ncbi:MbcA/ParS/Xre antitoxin family protein [Bosea sp. LjRoot9]|uniref:MbcA/ParS/Xre antitoxin family protein n=1 Tax=Bosea sp. LjRoot9 TaxID=3342341 RepID=UPI003ECEB2EC